MDHILRMQRAIDYIEEHLKDDLPVESVAKVACFSMWHFQRVFSSVVGDSVKEYIRKRRLASALGELVSTERRILDIAVDHRFESQESFTRAFKVHFGMTPGESRKGGARSILSWTKPRITLEYLDHLYGGMTMQPRFETIQAKKVVGVGDRFISVLSPQNNSHQVVPALWAAFRERAGEVEFRANQVNIGYTEVMAAGSKSHPDEYFYVAGTEVTDVSQVPDGMVIKTIPAGRHAVFTHQGRVDKLEHTMRYIFGSWLPKSGEELRDAPTFSVIGENFKADSNDAETDIYIPVE